MSESLSRILHAQFEAALAMLADCITACPPTHWDGLVAKYPFWLVAYHTLCFADLYLATDEKQFHPHAMHPSGWNEFNDEYPSRRFEQPELIAYAALCRRKAADTFAAETTQSLAGPSGHARLDFTRTELHIYNIRHIQHHAAQLAAFLRRVDESIQSQDSLRWAKSGWPKT